MVKKIKQKRYLKENTVKILLLVIVVWFIGSFAVNQARRNLVQTETVHTTVLEQVDSGYGLLSGTETLIPAPADGVVERMVAEGDRVRKGNAVFGVGGAIAYTNDAGRVSYHIDGIEGNTDLTSICGSDLPAKYAEQQSATENQEPADAVSGAVYAKVINVFDDIYFYLTVPRTSYTSGLEVDQQIPLRLVDLDYEVRGTITEAVDAADGNRYLKIKLGSVKEIVFGQRIYQVELPYDRVSALAVPEKALVKKKGETGVYYLQKGFVFWKAVTLGEIRSEQGMVIIEKTPESENEDSADSGLQEGDIIVTTPHFVHEGENIKF